MIKEIEYKTPIYENVQVGEITETKWETSDGEQFEHKSGAEWHEFYQCKVKQRGLNLPVENAMVFELSSVDDLDKIEKDYLYDEHIKKYQKEKLVFPNTYVMYQKDDPDFNYDDYYAYTPDILVYLVTMEEYKQLLTTALEKL